MVPEYVLDGMVDRCEFCGALNFPAERVGTSVSRRVTLCYKGGKLSHLPPIPDAPEPLRSWLLAPGAQSGFPKQHSSLQRSLVIRLLW